MHFYATSRSKARARCRSCRRRLPARSVVVTDRLTERGGAGGHHGSTANFFGCSSAVESSAGLAQVGRAARICALQRCLWRAAPPEAAGLAPRAKLWDARQRLQGSAAAPSPGVWRWLSVRARSQRGPTQPHREPCQPVSDHPRSPGVAGLPTKRVR